MIFEYLRFAEYSGLVKLLSEAKQAKSIFDWARCFAVEIDALSCADMRCCSATRQWLVKHEEADIRYKPLEFDGWRRRHWTRPFRGERFTIVWFTPASSGR